MNKFKQICELFLEILQEDAALWPSPEGGSLLLGKFNDSRVRQLPILNYGGGFPKTSSLRYPTVSYVNLNIKLLFI